MINQLYHTWTALGGANIDSRHIESIHFQEGTIIINFQIVVKVPLFDLRTLTKTQRSAVRETVSPGVAGNDDYHWFFFYDHITAPFGKLTPELAREEYRRFVDDTDAKLEAWREFVPGL